ncbi:hypothetical protein ACLKA6_013988 [Drosophila palustris]
MVAEDMISRGPYFLNRIKTCDETWVYEFDTLTSQKSSECRMENEPDPKKPNSQSVLKAIPESAYQKSLSLLWQDTHQSLLLRDQVFSPCSVRTFINPCCCGIKSTVLALPGHSSIFAAAGSSHQSLLSQDIHQSLLLRDPVISPCFGRIINNPC